MNSTVAPKRHGAGESFIALKLYSAGESVLALRRYGASALRRLLYCVALVLLFISLPSFAEEPKILEYNKDQKTIKVEIEGKEYTLDVPAPEHRSAKAPLNNGSIAEDDDTEILQGTIIKKRYAKGPLTSTAIPRLYNMPTDTLLQKNGIRFDFTHRFSQEINEETANDLYGLDSFAYTGIGLYYGITDYLELHGFRSSLTDAHEVGLKLSLLKETDRNSKLRSPTSNVQSPAHKVGEARSLRERLISNIFKWPPVSLTLSGGFQNDNIQNSIDFYVQPIVSKVIIPRWLKFYAAPTWSDKSATIGQRGSLSASFFRFLDPKDRGFKKSSGTFAVPLGATLNVLPNGRLSVFGEYTPVVSGYKEVENGWAFGLQILSRLQTHVWTIGVSNVPYSSFGQFVVGGPSNNWHLGFNIAARIK